MKRLVIIAVLTIIASLIACAPSTPSTSPALISESAVTPTNTVSIPAATPSPTPGWWTFDNHPEIPEPKPGYQTLPFYYPPWKVWYWGKWGLNGCSDGTKGDLGKVGTAIREKGGVRIQDSKIGVTGFYQDGKYYLTSSDWFIYVPKCDTIALGLNEKQFPPTPAFGLNAVKVDVWKDPGCSESEKYISISVKNESDATITVDIYQNNSGPRDAFPYNPIQVVRRMKPGDKPTCNTIPAALMEKATWVRVAIRMLDGEKENQYPIATGITNSPILAGSLIQITFR